MNERFTMPPKRVPTQAAEGLPRWRWTVAEIERIAATGFFTEYDRFELLGGEMVPMSPEGRRHETVRTRLLNEFSRLLPKGIFFAPDAQFNLSDDTFAEPDILLHSTVIQTYDLRPADALLLVEIADTSFRYDIRSKMTLYAEHGVPEYWVIHAASLVTTIHREPSRNTYRFIREFPSDAMLVPSLIPELAVSLATLTLD
jgi:Uma2 family endonuclease